MVTPQIEMTESPLSSDARKDSPAFGLKVMRQCYARWKNGYGGETYSARMLRYEKNRLYAMGRQPTDQYKDLVKIEGTPVVLNLDYSPLAIATPLLNAKADRYMQREEEIKCMITGPGAASKKKAQKENARFKLNYGPAIQKLQEQAGLQLEDFSDTDPKSERELEVKSKTEPIREEVIMQLAERMVFEQNQWADVIKPRLIWDTFNCGFAVTLTELDGNGWIKTPFVIPENFITSYSTYDNFEDWQWQGQRRSMSISEVRLRTYGKKKPNGEPVITEEELWQLATKFSGTYGNSSDWICGWDWNFQYAVARPYDAINVEIVDLFYKTLYNLEMTSITNKYGRENIVYPEEVKGGIRDEVKPLKSKPYYVAYHGVWIIDTDYVLEWGLAKNMLKPNNNLVEIRSPYTIHMHNNNKCRNTPLTETMIPLIDLIQNIHMQTQKIIAMTAPDGFNVDVLGLANMDLGQGVGVVSPMQAFGIYLQTGTQYFMGKDIDLDGREQKPPITPNNHPYSDKLAQLDIQFWSAYKKLQIITGDNNIASGNITNQAVANSTLNDAREIAAEPSNYVYKTVLNVMKGTAKNVELLLLDKFFLNDQSFDGYLMAMGEDDIAYMRELVPDMANLMFETKLEVALDAVDQEKWDSRVDLALETGQIGLDAVARLDMIDDPTYKSFMLAQYIKEKQAKDQEIAAQNSANNVQQAEAAGRVKADGDMALEQLIHQNKLDQIKEEQNSMMLKQNSEFSGILKAKVADAILIKPGANIADVPSFIWEGLGITEEAQKASVMGYLQGLAEKEQAKLQQQQAEMQQQQMEQQQAQLQAPQEQMVA